MSQVTRLVINADDGFYADRRDEGIVHCLRSHNGGVTDVSVLMNGAVARRLQQLHLNNGADSILYRFCIEAGFHPGIHLNLTEGTPLCKPTEVHTILDNYGNFLGKHGLREHFSESDLPKPNLEHVEREMERQLMNFRTLFTGPPSHADGHQHIHVLPGVVEVLCRLLPRHNVPFIRVPDESLLSKQFVTSTWMTSSQEHLEQVSFYSRVSEQARSARSLFTSAGLRSTDFFVGMCLMGENMTIDHVSSAVEMIPSGSTIEFMTHPGYKLSHAQPMATLEAGCYTSNSPDEFSCSDDRKHEMDFLTGHPFSHLIKRKFKLCSFLELQTTTF